MNVFAIGILFLLVIIFAALIVLLLRWKHGKYVLAVAFVIMGLFAFLSLFRSSIQITSLHEAKREAEYKVRAELQGNSKHASVEFSGVKQSPGIDWLTANEKFLADVYPSPGAAAVALARHLTHSWDEVPSAGTPEKLIVRKDKSIPDDRFLGIINDLRRYVSGHLQIVTDNKHQRSTQPTDTLVDNTGNAVLEYTNVTTTQPSTMIEKLDEGILQATLTTRQGKKTRSTRYVHKLWLEDFSKFTSQNRSGEWLVTHSSGLATSHQEAYETAVNQAIAKIRGMIKPLLSAPVSSDLDHDSLCSAVRQEDMIRDRFDQKFTRPYGQLYHTAILVNTDSSALQQVADRLQQQRSSKIRQVLGRAGTALGSILVILIAYLFANAATRGYYTWALRTVFFAVIIAAITFISEVYG